MGNITASIDLKKIDQKLCIKGDKGTYANISIIPNKDGEDKYGNTHMIVQTVPKTLRTSKEQRGPILGNGKIWDDQPRNRSEEPDGGSANWEDEDQEIPF